MTCGCLGGSGDMLLLRWIRSDMGVYVDQVIGVCLGGSGHRLVFRWIRSYVGV